MKAAVLHEPGPLSIEDVVVADPADALRPDGARSGRGRAQISDGGIARTVVVFD